MRYLLNPLGDEILKPLNATCNRDNECQNTCCSSGLCSDFTICTSERMTLILVFSLLCIFLIIGGVIAYVYCMKKRRTTRYDNRLNSIRTDSITNHDLLHQPLTNSSNKRVVSNKAINQ